MYPILDPYQKIKTHGHTLLYKAIMGNCVEIVEYICQEYFDLLSEPDINDWMPIHIAAIRNPDSGICLVALWSATSNSTRSGLWWIFVGGKIYL